MQHRFRACTRQSGVAKSRRKRPHATCAERDSWARVKSGMYKDDLARVIDVDYSTGRATIEVVPRIDYALLASKERALPFGRTPTVRPAPRCAGAWYSLDLHAKAVRSCMDTVCQQLADAKHLLHLGRSILYDSTCLAGLVPGTS